MDRLEIMFSLDAIDGLVAIATNEIAWPGIKVSSTAASVGNVWLIVYTAMHLVDQSLVLLDQLISNDIHQNADAN